MRLELERIGVDHDLAVAAAERLRHGRAGHAGQLVAHDVLREVVQLRLGQAFAFEGEQAHRQARRVELQHDRRQRAGRQPAQFRHREIADIATAASGFVPGWK